MFRGTTRGTTGAETRGARRLFTVALAVLAITGCDFFAGRRVPATAPCEREIVGFDTLWAYNDARTDSLLIEVSRTAPTCEGES